MGEHMIGIVASKILFHCEYEISAVLCLCRKLI